MDEINVISKIQKALKDRLQHIGDSILAGGVDNMEKYKYLVGQAHAIQLTLQEISNLLNPKEQKNEPGNIIDITGKGSTKN
jgi:uncharacterized protein YaaN involved in tellurite resistance